MEALRKQTRPINAIYIIDNASIDEIPRLLKERGYLSELPPKILNNPLEKETQVSNLVNFQLMKVYYVRMHENTGGAEGFYEGVKRAYEKGYDWLWLMDDDVEPDINCLNNQLIIAKKSENIAGVFPIKLFFERIIGGGTLYFDLKNIFLRKVFFKIWLSIHAQLNEIIERLPSIIEMNGGPFGGLLMIRTIMEKVGLPMK